MFLVVPQGGGRPAQQVRLLPVRQAQTGQTAHVCQQHAQQLLRLWLQQALNDNNHWGGAGQQACQPEC